MTNKEAKNINKNIYKHVEGVMNLVHPLDKTN